MTFSLPILAIALAFAAIPPTRSAEIQVTVGGPGGVVAYNPPSVVRVEFQLFNYGF
jgi:hypothetical protein